MAERQNLYINGKLVGEVKVVSVEINASASSAFTSAFSKLLANLALPDRLATEFGNTNPRISHDGP